MYSFPKGENKKTKGKKIIHHFCLVNDTKISFARFWPRSSCVSSNRWEPARQRTEITVSEREIFQVQFRCSTMVKSYKIIIKLIHFTLIWSSFENRPINPGPAAYPLLDVNKEKYFNEKLQTNGLHIPKKSNQFSFGLAR